MCATTMLCECGEQLKEDLQLGKESAVGRKICGRENVVIKVIGVVIYLRCRVVIDRGSRLRFGLLTYHEIWTHSQIFRRNKIGF